MSSRLFSRRTAVLLACGAAFLSAATSAISANAAAKPAAANAGALIAPYVSKPSAFPVTQKLTRIPKGATIAYVDCGTPVCALGWGLVSAAAKTMGVKLVDVRAGTSASTVSSAFNSVVALHPSAVIVVAIPTELWSRQAAELKKKHIPVITGGVTGTGQLRVKAPQFAETQATLSGKLLAAYVAAKFGASSNVVIYNVPELSFSQILVHSFAVELSRVCPGCSLRTSNISAAAIGTTAPSQVVSDLEANPSTTVAVFATDEAEIGLPTALKSAGITVKTIGQAPTPVNLQYLKAGQETATLALDFPVMFWTLLDQAAREIIGQPLSGGEAHGLAVNEFLTQKNDVFGAAGWTGYPHFAQRFAKLWGVKAH